MVDCRAEIFGGFFNELVDGKIFKRGGNRQSIHEHAERLREFDIAAAVAYRREKNFSARGVSGDNVIQNRQTHCGGRQKFFAAEIFHVAGNFLVEDFNLAVNLAAHVRRNFARRLKIFQHLGEKFFVRVELTFLLAHEIKITRAFRFKRAALQQRLEIRQEQIHRRAVVNQDDERRRRG